MLVLRDAEVKRLAAASAEGPDVDRLAQQYRNDANEAVILQLNQQVGLPQQGCANTAVVQGLPRAGLRNGASRKERPEPRGSASSA